MIVFHSIRVKQKLELYKNESVNELNRQKTKNRKSWIRIQTL